MEAWWVKPWERCAKCRRPAQDPHHVVREQVVRRLLARTVRGVDLARWVWDQRNRLALCRDCHSAHHHPEGESVTWATVEKHAPHVAAFAAELDAMGDGQPATQALRRDYPQ